jgi:phospholipid/cholesterol/gamma-HCH transport system substrate-binding protein
LARSGLYPTTEQTLATLSMVLNGGGIGKIGDITEAFSTALRGREKDLRSLIGQLDRFTAYLNDQSGDIIAATESLNRLAGQVAEQQPVVDRALETIPDALAELNKQRENLVEAADKLGQFSALITDTVNQSKEDVVKILRDTGPVLESLANAGPSMTRALSGLATFPFPNETIDKWQRGDYGNLTGIFDLTLSRLDASFFTGTRFECNLTELELQWGRTIGQLPSPCTAGGPGRPGHRKAFNLGNPLVAPYQWDQGP